MAKEVFILNFLSEDKNEECGQWSYGVVIFENGKYTGDITHGFDILEYEKEWNSISPRDIPDDCWDQLEHLRNYYHYDKFSNFACYVLNLAS